MKKKKQLTLLIVFGVLILALTGGIVGMSLYQKNKDKREQEQSSREAEENEARLKIFSRDTKEFAKISYTNPSGNRNDYLYDAETDTWSSEEDPDYPLAQANLASIATVCSQLKAARVAADTVDDPALYGLDKPDYVLTITDRDGKNTVLRIGMKNDYYNNYYMTVDGNDTLYMIGTTLPGYLDKNLSDMLGVARLNVPDQGEIRELEVQDHFTLTYRMEGSKEYSYYPTEVYFLNHGKDGMTAADSDVANEVLEAAAMLSSNNCVSYKPSEEDLEAMNLTDDKSFRVTYTYVKAPETVGASTGEEGEKIEKFVLLIGSAIREETPEGTEQQGKVIGYYVMPEGGDAVYNVDSEPLNKIFLKHEADFFPKIYSKVLQSNVDSMDISMGGEQKIRYELKRHEETNEDGDKITKTEYFMNGTPLPSEYFVAIFYELGRKSYDRVLTEADQIPDEYKPELEITYHTNLEFFEKITIGYMTYDSNYDIVYLNGEPKALINFRDIEEVEKDLGEALDVLEMLEDAPETETQTAE